MNDVQQEFNQDFTVRGDLRIEAKTYNLGADKGAEIFCFADVEWRGEELNDILFLKLDSEGSIDSRWLVSDEFSRLIPHMLSVRAFRQYLIKQLEAFVEAREYTSSDPVRSGIYTYIAELKSFSDARALIGQVKDCVGEIRRYLQEGMRPYTEEFVASEMRKLLTIMGAKPRVDRPFINKK